MRLPRTWSIRTRLALWHAVSLAAILTLMGFAALKLHDRTLRAEVDGDLRLIAAEAFDLLALGAPPAEVAAALDRLDEPAFIQLFYRIAPDEGPAVTGGTRPPGLPVHVSREGPGEPIGLRTERFPGGEARILAGSASTPKGSVRAVEVGTSLDELDASRKSLTRVFLLVGPLGVLLAGAGGYWLASRALQPVAAITERARTLSVGRLGKDRLPISNPDDELGRLAATINAMLDRLARAVDEIRRFSADASHELKTPLTILKGELDLAARGERRPDAYRAVLASALEEVDRMIGIVDRLLRLARAESGEVRYERAPIALDRLVREVADHLRTQAERGGVAIEVEVPDPVTVLGEDARLREVVVILLDNAIRYTPAGGSVRVRVARGPGTAALVVEDTGVGIPADVLPRIFEPFFRADSSRTREGGGSGLGLAIARATVEGHGGQIEIASRVGVGTTVTASLPAAPAS